MSIRSNSLPTRTDLSPELQDLLRRNGMRGHIIYQGGNFQLAVQGHDSPLLTYPISANQVKTLTDWGTNYANKQAYDTFASLVEKDFYIPRNFVHARNANGRVAMGLHGYRIGVGEYGREAWDRRGPMWACRDRMFLGWTPRQQEGWHMRRVGGALFMQGGAPMVPDRPDARMKPGELKSGAYGFYWKGPQQEQILRPKQDVLAELKTVITPMEVRPRITEPATPYKELVASDVYFSNEKLKECLESHGISIDAEKKTLTIQSSATRQDFVYDLTEDEVKKLDSNSIKEASVQQRLDIINEVIKNDFEGKVTMDTLNSKEQISIPLHPQVAAELSPQVHETVNLTPEVNIEDKSVAHIDGNDLYNLNENKGWYREGLHGREVQVDDIKVEKINQSPIDNTKGESMYRMTAVINGESISHEITQKQYDKFMAIDDYHRMKLFSHIFDEVDMKTHPEMRAEIGAKIGGALLAGVAVVGELAHIHHCEPAVFVEHHHHEGPHVYFKPGVDSPHDLAARAFEAGLNAGETGVGLGR